MTDETSKCDNRKFNLLQMAFCCVDLFQLKFSPRETIALSSHQYRNVFLCSFAWNFFCFECKFHTHTHTHNHAFLLAMISPTHTHTHMQTWTNRTLKRERKERVCVGVCVCVFGFHKFTCCSRRWILVNFPMWKFEKGNFKKLKVVVIGSTHTFKRTPAACLTKK